MRINPTLVSVVSVPRRNAVFSLDREPTWLLPTDKHDKLETGIDKECERTIRLETVNASPMMGRPSNNAAANPKTVRNQCTVKAGVEERTSVIPFALLDECSLLCWSHLLRFEILEKVS